MPEKRRGDMDHLLFAVRRIANEGIESFLVIVETGRIQPFVIHRGGRLSSTEIGQETEMHLIISHSCEQ